MSTYIVTAPAVVAYKTDGSHALFYKDAVLPEGLREGERERLTNDGLVRKTDAAAHIDPGSKDDPGAGGQGSPPADSGAGGGGKSSAKGS